MAWLVTGGAGYVGAHVVRDLISSGRDVVVLDDLSTGRAARLPDGVALVRGEVGSRRAVRQALLEHPVTGVMHLASQRDPQEAVANPLRHWCRNIGGLQVLLEEMVAAGVSQLVHASSAAVYGTAPSGADQRPEAEAHIPRISESSPARPAEPCGATALAGEWMISATVAANDWRALSLRLFEVAGTRSPELADPLALNLIAGVLDALAAGRPPALHGDDHATPDGSRIRDYVHVADVSAALLAAVRVVEHAHTDKVGTVEPVDAVRSATERVQHAAAMAELAASRLPGGSRAVEVATHVPDAAEAAAEIAARAAARVPAAARALEFAAARLPGAVRAGTASASVREQAAELVAEVASQLSSLVARVAGLVEAPPLLGHMAINIGSGRGYSDLEVVTALRTSVGAQFGVDVMAKRAYDPPALVAGTDLAAQMLGWRPRLTLADMVDSERTARSEPA
ncbi:MAG: NAD-dependent epimerase/dehydratase family protein [Candidatus Nanopelagicales bacterium]